MGECIALFGRETIYSTTDRITPENVIQQVNKALGIHIKNLLDEDKLYWYRRGVTPVLNREKEVRPEINNKVNEGGGVANSIVDFKNGYFLTQPAKYISRKDEAQDKVDILNEYLYRSGKQNVDNDLVDWFHTVGRAALFVRATGDDEVPVEAFALDPRQAFCVYSLTPGNRPVMGINTVIADETLLIDVYTEDKIYRLKGTKVGNLLTSENVSLSTATSIESVEDNLLRKIPIIEYNYNSVGMGAFEGVISHLNALAEAQSDRIDGLSQQIQNLLVLYNCELEDGTTANTIRQAGMIQLRNTGGDNKADVKDITTIIDQSQTQVLIDGLYERILAMCAMPSTSKGGTSTSDTGAAVLARDGWYQADCAARNTEDLFKKSNKRFDEIFIDILRRVGKVDIGINDFELHFVRNETSNIQSKAQSFQTLMSAGLHPVLAAAKSGISNDPVADVLMSEKYLKMRWGDPDKPKGESVIQEPIGEEADLVANDDGDVEDQGGNASV